MRYLPSQSVMEGVQSNSWRVWLSPCKQLNLCSQLLGQKHYHCPNKKVFFKSGDYGADAKHCRSCWRSAWSPPESPGHPPWSQGPTILIILLDIIFIIHLKEDHFDDDDQEADNVDDDENNEDDG